MKHTCPVCGGWMEHHCNSGAARETCTWLFCPKDSVTYCTRTENWVISPRSTSPDQGEPA